MEDSEIKKHRRIKKKWIKLFAKFTVILTAILVLTQYLFTFVYMRGNYMFPNIKDGDVVVAYRFDTYVQEDLVIYKTDDGLKVGRVVALEGDTISFTDDGELMINGSVASEEIFYATTANSSTLEYPYTVKSGEVFILNDYRSLSETDSRQLGGIKTSEIKGKVFFQLRRRGF